MTTDRPRSGRSARAGPSSQGPAVAGLTQAPGRAAGRCRRLGARFAAGCVMASMVSGLAWSQARPPAPPPGTQAAQSPQAPAERMQLRIVGGLAGVNQYTRHEAPFWTDELPRRTQGRYTAEIVPFDRAGIRGQEMLQL